jgi:hypothetical protein
LHLPVTATMFRSLWTDPALRYMTGCGCIWSKMVVLPDRMIVPCGILHRGNRTEIGIYCLLFFSYHIPQIIIGNRTG